MLEQALQRVLHGLLAHGGAVAKQVQELGMPRITGPCDSHPHGADGLVARAATRERYPGIRSLARQSSQ